MSSQKFKTAPAPPSKPSQPADYLTPPGHPIGCGCTGKCIHCTVDRQDLTEKVRNSLKRPLRRGIGRNRYKSRL